MSMCACHVLYAASYITIATTCMYILLLARENSHGICMIQRYMHAGSTHVFL